MFISFLMVFALCGFTFSHSPNRDVCTRHGVLKQIDSFLIVQKESSHFSFDVSELHDKVQQLELAYPSFATNLDDYANLKTKIVERNLIPFTEDTNLIKITGSSDKLLKICRDLGASLLAPASDDEIDKIQQILPSLNIIEVPINIGVNRGSIVSLDESVLGDSGQDPFNASLLNAFSQHFPLLSSSDISPGSANDNIVALCTKPNNPWDRPGSNKQKWLSMGKTLLQSLPSIVSTIKNIKETFFTNSPSVVRDTVNTSVSYPIPHAMNNLLQVITRLSSASAWEQIKNLTLFKNLLSDLKKVSSVFKPLLKPRKLIKRLLAVQNSTPSSTARDRINYGLTIDTETSPTVLGIDPDSIIMGPSVFYPSSFKDTNSDSVTDQVSGSLVLRYASKTDLITVFEYAPLLYGTCLASPLFLVLGPSFREIAYKQPPTGTHCVATDGFKVCLSLSRTLVPRSASVDPDACLKVLMGEALLNIDSTKCPKAETDNQLSPSVIGFRMDCGDNVNTVIDSKRELLIVLVCDGNEGDGFLADHFPLFLNTDCGLRANYIGQTDIVLELPQIEASAELIESVTSYTPFENTIRNNTSSFMLDILNLSQAGIYAIVGLVVAFFLFLILSFIAILYCCLGYTKFKEFMLERFPCCRQNPPDLEKAIESKKNKCSCSSKLCCIKIKSCCKPSSCCNQAQMDSEIYETIDFNKIKRQGSTRSSRSARRTPRRDSLSSIEARDKIKSLIYSSTRDTAIKDLKSSPPNRLENRIKNDF